MSASATAAAKKRNNETTASPSTSKSEEAVNSNSNNSEMFTLCLTCGGGGGGGGGGGSRRIIISVPSSSTLQDLYRHEAVLGMTMMVPPPAAASSSPSNKKKKNKKKADEEPAEALLLSLAGTIPPAQPLLPRDSPKTLVEVGIRHQDRIVVSAVTATATATATTKGNGNEKAAAAATAGAKKRKKEDDDRGGDDDAEGGGKKEKTKEPNQRAAASAASASFKDTIRRQDAFARAEQTRQKQKKMKKAAASSPNKPTTNRPSAAATTSSSPPPTAAKPNRHFAALSGTPGRRLQDGAVVGGTTSPRGRNSKSSRRRTGSSNDDDDGIVVSAEDRAALALLDAADGGGASTSSGGRLMRAGWKRAVLDAFENNRAVSRLAAAAGNRVVFRLVGADDRDGGAAAGSVTADGGRRLRRTRELVATYPKGVQGKGDFVDTVDYIARPVLRTVIGGIHPANPEALRPENLALLSPRVLWSLMYHYKLELAQQQGGRREYSVGTALQWIQPGLDWSFLRRRKAQLSAKAMENLRQEREAAASGSNDSSNEDWEAAANAIMSVEQALEDDLLSTRDDNMPSRSGQHQNGLLVENEAWNVVTPNESDEDELRDCVRRGNELSPETVESIVKALIEKCEIHNWRELANVSDADEIASKLRSNIAESGDVLVPSPESVQLWIDAAQEESLPEIMVEICDGTPAFVEMLQEVESGTPLDLARWRSIADTLRETLQERRGVSGGDVGTSATDNAVEVPLARVLQRWCARAQKALEQLEWLGQYATPVV